MGLRIDLTGELLEDTRYDLIWKSLDYSVDVNVPQRAENYIWDFLYGPLMRMLEYTIWDGLELSLMEIFGE